MKLSVPSVAIFQVAPPSTHDTPTKLPASRKTIDLGLMLLLPLIGSSNLVEQSANTRGCERGLWSQGTDIAVTEKKQPTHSTFILILSAYLQPLIRDAVQTLEMAVVNWATKVLEPLAKHSLRMTNKTQCQTQACRSP